MQELERMWDDQLRRDERTRITKVAESLCTNQIWYFCSMFLGQHSELQDKNPYQEQMLVDARAGDPVAIMQIDRLSGRSGLLSFAEAFEMKADAGIVSEALERVQRNFRLGGAGQAYEWHTQILQTAGPYGLINLQALSDSNGEASGVASRERLEEMFDWSDDRIDLELSCVCRKYTGSCGASRNDAYSAGYGSGGVNADSEEIVVVGAGLCISSFLYR